MCHRFIFILKHSSHWSSFQLSSLCKKYGNIAPICNYCRYLAFMGVLEPWPKGLLFWSSGACYHTRFDCCTRCIVNAWGGHCTVCCARFNILSFCWRVVLLTAAAGRVVTHAFPLNYMPEAGLLPLPFSFCFVLSFRSVRTIAGPGGVIGPLPRAKQRWASHQ